MNATQRKYILNEAYASLQTKLKAAHQVSAKAIETRKEFVTCKKALHSAIAMGKLKLRKTPTSAAHTLVEAFYNTKPYYAARTKLAIKEGVGEEGIDYPYSQSRLHNPVNTGTYETYYGAFTKTFANQLVKANKLLKDLHEELMVGTDEDARKVLETIRNVAL